MTAAAPLTALVLLAGPWLGRSIRFSEELSADLVNELGRIAGQSAAEDKGNAESWVSSNPSHHVIEFEAGAMGLRVGSRTGRVEELKSDGQAAQKAVQIGWYVHAINGGYQFTPVRMTRIANSGETYSVTFSEADEILANCVSDAAWADSDGADCQAYQASGWCSKGGWPTYEFKAVAACQSLHDCDFSHFAVADVSARDACCECGGGVGPNLVVPDPGEEPIVDPGDGGGDGDGNGGNGGSSHWHKHQWIWLVIGAGLVAKFSLCAFALARPPTDTFEDMVSELPTETIMQTRSTPARPVQGQQGQSLAPTTSEAPRRMAPSATAPPQRVAAMTSETSHDN